MAANTTPARKQRSQNRVSNLFFFRRRPLRSVPDEWTKPETDEEFEKIIEGEGFVSINGWQEKFGHDIRQHPLIAQDMKDLKQHLLPTFFQLNQKAKHYQNIYYYYQWVFVWGAFLTTLFGTIAAFTASSDSTLTRMFSVLTAIIGAVTAYFNALSNRGRPSERWAKTRTLAEELRGQYFKYLARISPYDVPDRVQILRANVVEVRVKEQENQGGAS